MDRKLIRKAARPCGMAHRGGSSRQTPKTGKILTTQIRQFFDSKIFPFVEINKSKKCTDKKEIYEGHPSKS
jgi:hypothetical protein